MTASFHDSAAALLPVILPAQAGSGLIVNGVLVAALAGAVIFAVCRSSRRN